jgi:hypothetical protein
MKLLLSIVTSLLLFSACGVVTESEKESAVQIDTMILVAPPDTPTARVSQNGVNILAHDTTIYIRYPDCHFSFDWVQVNNQHNNFEKRPDTLYFKLSPNHNIEGQMLAITISLSKNVKAWQRYETSVILNNSFLAGWKHYQSNWEPLKPEVQNFYICKSYSQAERTRFPGINLHSLKQYIQNAGISETFEQAVSLKQLPEKVDISRYYIRLEGLSTNKLLIFDVTTD